MSGVERGPEPASKQELREMARRYGESILAHDGEDQIASAAKLGAAMDALCDRVEELERQQAQFDAFVAYTAQLIGYEGDGFTGERTLDVDIDAAIARHRARKEQG